jgi:RND family efflux transporter MFP subunit
MSKLRCFNALLGLFLAGFLLGCGGAPSLAPPPVPKVTVSRPIVREVTDYEDFTGRTDAISTVDIRARVTGYLMKVTFKDGDIVKEGDLLYQIDPRPFQAALDQANGQVERLEAEKKLLIIQVDRYTKLAEKGAGSQQDLDEYVSKQAENVGAIKAAQAQVDMAKLNLVFTQITAPLTGRISRTLITPGNLVNADMTVLTTIKTIDPMYAYFDVEEPVVLRLRKMIREGIIKSHSARDVQIQMGLADDVERRFPLHGTLDFTNNTVDPQTGTLQVRGVFENSYTPGVPPVLTPGLFVRVRLRMGDPHQALLVTERAIGTDQGEKFVYVIDKENKVGYRRVKLGMLFDGLQAIEQGLKADDRLVVNGLQRIRPGIQVEADEADMASLAGPAGSQGGSSGQSADVKAVDKKASGDKPTGKKPADAKSIAIPDAPKP